MHKISLISLYRINSVSSFLYSHSHNSKSSCSSNTSQMIMQFSIIHDFYFLMESIVQWKQHSDQKDWQAIACVPTKFQDKHQSAMKGTATSQKQLCRHHFHSYSNHRHSFLSSQSSCSSAFPNTINCLLSVCSKACTNIVQYNPDSHFSRSNL